jgi:hypothetical protein
MSPHNSEEAAMPKYVVERDLVGAGQLSSAQLTSIAKKSCDVLRNMGPEIQWRESYVTGNKIYCVYIAANPDMIRQHAKEGDFPITRIEEVKSVIDPTTSEA